MIDSRPHAARDSAQRMDPIGHACALLAEQYSNSRAASEGIYDLSIRHTSGMPLSVTGSNFRFLGLTPATKCGRWLVSYGGSQRG